MSCMLWVFAAALPRRGSIHITLDIVRGRGPDPQIYPKAHFDRMITANLSVVGVTLGLAW